MSETKRVGIFGWGLVAPKSPNIDKFAENLETPVTWLEPYDGFGPSNFLVGNPEFDFEAYRAWFDERFPASKFSQLDDKMGPMTKYAMASFIQSLGQNDGIEQYLQQLGIGCHIYLGTGLGEATVQHQESVRYDRAERRWNAFWSSPERNSALSSHLSGESTDQNTPESPSAHEPGSEDWLDVKREWDRYWTAKSDGLNEYLAESATISGEPIPPSSGTAKLNTIRQKLTSLRKLNRKWDCPDPPWAAVSPNYLWNIANIPASQVSMIGKIMGPAVAPVAACASFGVALKLGWNAIQLGQATAAVIGMTDPPPHPVTISAFYNANVLSADGEVSRPMTGLKGTHVAGGACVWIIGDYEKMTAQGFKPLGLEIVSVGMSSDAHHIITPSKEGPHLAMDQAMEGIQPGEIATWDLHATATPGDSTEVSHSLEKLSEDVVLTARKGTFGHGMSVGGGWELTAQHLGITKGSIYPTVLGEDDVHADIRDQNPHLVLESATETREGYAGKLSMGIGGVNSCVISRRW